MLNGGGRIAVSSNRFVSFQTRSTQFIIPSAQLRLEANWDPFNLVQGRPSSSSPTPILAAVSVSSNFVSPLKCIRMEKTDVEGESIETSQASNGVTAHEVCCYDPKLVENMVHDGLIWCSLHGLIVGDRAVQRSGSVPGVGMTHAPFSLIPVFFPEAHYKLACELAPILNELMDRVSLDDQFLQDSLSRTRKVDDFTSRLLDIHLTMISMNRREGIRLGLHRSDYMLDEQTKSLLQIEFNTISSSFAGLSGLVTELHRNVLKHYGNELGLDFRKVPENKAALQFVEALAKAWSEYNKPRAVIMVVSQPEERNMYDQHWLFSELKEKHGISSIRKTLAEIDSDGELLADGTLAVNGNEVALVYFRAGYTPTDYPSELEWRARLLIEQSCAIKCPSIAYHLAGTKKIQQELAKPNMLERFLESKDEIALIRKCFAGLWSLDDSNIVEDAIEKPHLYVMKPQREGGGNNIYGEDVRDSLIRFTKDGNVEDAAAYILMQRIFPAMSPAYLVRDGVCREDKAISELGIYSTYLRNEERVIVNQESGYLMRTKVASSNEGGVASGYAVLDSLYLIEKQQSENGKERK